MKKIYLLRHRSAVIMISSNLKACYDCIIYETPTHLHKHFKSYSQVTRLIKQSNEIPFPLPDRDWYYIELRQIMTKFTAPKKK